MQMQIQNAKHTETYLANDKRNSDKKRRNISGP